jgi:DNA-binding transcriptional MerR regulator/effector-binding domain-containing protein
MGVEVSGITLFTIGEFSRISGITVKALRFYHEQHLLIPTSIDPQSGYRYYHESLIEPARAIVYLRELELPIESIRQILEDAQDDDAQLIASLQKHKKEIEQRIRALEKAVRSLDQFIQNERQVKAMSAQVTYDIQEKSVNPMLIAGIRAKGKYGDCGKRFGQICRSFGRFCSGPPMTLYYDCEYKENDADFEACVPVKQAKNVEGISVHEIPGGRAVTLLHRGPYDQLHASYAKITAYVKEKGYTVAGPTREIYLKGPGMIFKGNPKKYLTEIQFPIA